MIFYYLWQLITLVQIFFSYGTAYRFTKRGGDNGVAFFGWLLVFELASMIPGLGFYFWFKYKNIDAFEYRRPAGFNAGTTNLIDTSPLTNTVKGWECRYCRSRNPQMAVVCNDCGKSK